MTGQRVSVDTCRGESVEGTVIKGTWLPEIRGFDLDAPFTVLTEHGETVRVSSPWNCDVEVLS